VEINRELSAARDGCSVLVETPYIYTRIKRALAAHVPLFLTIPLEYEDLQTICVFGSLRGNRRYCNLKNIKMEIEGGVQNDLSKMCPEWKLVNIEVTDDYTSLSQDTLRIGDLIRLPEPRVSYFPSNTAASVFCILAKTRLGRTHPRNSCKGKMRYFFRNRI
jgi:hypothetical protein